MRRQKKYTGHKSSNNGKGRNKRITLNRQNTDGRNCSVYCKKKRKTTKMGK